MQIYFSSKMQWRSLFENAFEFLQLTPHDRNLPQGELFSRSKSFLLFKRAEVLKKVKNNAEM